MYDLVSAFGIEKSLTRTEDCLSQITEEVLINKIKDYIA